MQENVFYATGKRKTAKAKTWIKPGTGNITINGRSVEEYFPTEQTKMLISQPMKLTNMAGSFDVTVQVLGGGITGQAGAVRHGITRALIEVDPDLRIPLKRAGFVKRDPRQKERKKYGRRGARARYQFSKR